MLLKGWWMLTVTYDEHQNPRELRWVRETKHEIEECLDAQESASWANMIESKKIELVDILVRE